MLLLFFFFFKQKTAYELRIGDWSSDVCSSDLVELGQEWVPPLGGSYLRPKSLYGDMAYGGFQEYQFFYGQTNFGLDLSMDKILKGLSAKGLFTLDRKSVV